MRATAAETLPEIASAVGERIRIVFIAMYVNRIHIRTCDLVHTLNNIVLYNSSVTVKKCEQCRERERERALFAVNHFQPLREKGKTSEV